MIVMKTNISFAKGSPKKVAKFSVEQRVIKMTLFFSETEMLELIEDELLALVDEMMFTGFAEALPMTTESTWISLVKGALQMWFAEQQKIAEPTSLLDDLVTLIAVELTKMEKKLKSDEIRKYVNEKFDMINYEDRVQLLSERFREFIAEEYLTLEEKPGDIKWSGSPSDEIIILLVREVMQSAKDQEIKLAREELAKISDTKPSDVLDEGYIKVMSQQLLTFTGEEFQSYVSDVMTQLEILGVEEVDMNMLFQLYLLVKQELFTLLAKTVIKATSRERIEITSYGLSKILEGKQLIEEESVFGQIFVVLATGTAALVEEKSVNALDDGLLREFVKYEFEGLRHEDMLKLKYEGYIKFIIDEVIKLVSDINLAKNESGELLLNNVVELIATQFLLYAEDEMKLIAERLAKSIEGESNKLQKIGEETKLKLPMYDIDKLLKLFQMVEQELFAIALKSLANFTEKEMLELAEEGLSKILAEDVFKPIEKISIFGKVFISLGEEVSKMAKDDFARLEEEELLKLVKLEFQKNKYGKTIELFEEVYLKLISSEFIKMIEQEAVILSAHEEEKHQFGEMVRLLARKLLEIAM